MTNLDRILIEPNTRAGEALKPCSFCGSESKAAHRFSSLNTIPWVRVECQNLKCGAEGPLVAKIGERDGDCERYEAEAITAWNTRPLPQPSELVERLARVSHFLTECSNHALAQIVDEAAAQLDKLERADGADGPDRAVRGPLYQKPKWECASCVTPTTCAMGGRCMPIMGVQSDADVRKAYGIRARSQGGE